jgi:hypothetical protein
MFMLSVLPSERQQIAPSVTSRIVARELMAITKISNASTASRKSFPTGNVSSGASTTTPSKSVTAASSQTVSDTNCTEIVCLNIDTRFFSVFSRVFQDIPASWLMAIASISHINAYAAVMS